MESGKVDVRYRSAEQKTPDEVSDEGTITDQASEKLKMLATRLMIAANKSNKVFRALIMCMPYMSQEKSDELNYRENIDAIMMQLLDVEAQTLREFPAFMERAMEIRKTFRSDKNLSDADIISCIIDAHEAEIKSIKNKSTKRCKHIALPEQLKRSSDKRKFLEMKISEYKRLAATISKEAEKEKENEEQTASSERKDFEIASPGPQGEVKACAECAKLQELRHLQKPTEKALNISGNNTVATRDLATPDPQIEAVEIEKNTTEIEKNIIEVEKNIAVETPRNYFQTTQELCRPSSPELASLGQESSNQSTITVGDDLQEEEYVIVDDDIPAEEYVVTVADHIQHEEYVVAVGDHLHDYSALTVADDLQQDVIEYAAIVDDLSQLEESVIENFQTEDSIVTVGDTLQHDATTFDIRTCTLTELDQHMAYLVRLSNEKFARFGYKMDLRPHPDCYPDSMIFTMPEFKYPVGPCRIKGVARYRGVAQGSQSGKLGTGTRETQQERSPADRTQSAGQLINRY